MRVRAFGDLTFCALLVAGGYVVLGELEKTSHAPFDPLGSATVPRVLVYAVMAMAALVILRTILGMQVRSVASGLDAPREARDARRNLLQAGALVVMTGFYLATIANDIVPFSISTAALVACGTYLLAIGRPVRTRTIVVSAVLAGAGGELLFVHFLHLPLPGF